MNISNADVRDDVDAVCLRSYLICAAPRTGSTLLSSMLMDTAVAGQPFEFIHDLSLQEFFARVGGPLELKEYVKFLKERRCSRNGVFGFKAQYNQLSDMVPGIDDQCEFIRCFDKVILIYRKNGLAQAISHYRALLTGVWYETIEMRISGIESIIDKYDVAEIAKSMAAVIGQPESWRRLLRKCEADWLEVAYEDLSQDPVGILVRVMKYLDIDVDVMPKAPSPRLRRQSDEVSREWGERFVADLLGVPGELNHGDNVRKLMTRLTRLMRGRISPARN